MIVRLAIGFVGTGAAALMLACGPAAETSHPLSGVLSPPESVDLPAPRFWSPEAATTPVAVSARIPEPDSIAVPTRPLPSTTSTVAATTPPTTSTTAPPTPTTVSVAHQLLQKPTPPRSATPPTFTLGQLVGYFFREPDRAWALRVAFCESSAQPDDTISDAIHPSSRASGWFQHLPKFWEERSEAAGFAGVNILDPVANVGVAAWLLYETSQGSGHWYPSERCWKS